MLMMTAETYLLFAVQENTLMMTTETYLRSLTPLWNPSFNEVEEMETSDESRHAFKIRKNVTNFMLFALVFSMMTTISFFSIEFTNSVYLYGGLIIIDVWIIIYYYTRNQLKNEFNLDNDLLAER